MPFCCQLIFFQINFFQNILSGIPYECQSVWIQIRPDLLLGLVWVQTVCKVYQQKKLADKSYKYFEDILKCRGYYNPLLHMLFLYHDIIFYF